MAMFAQWWRLYRSAVNSLTALLVGHRLRLAAMAVTALVMCSLVGCLALGMLAFLSQGEFLAFKSRLVDSVLALFFFAVFVFVSISDAVLVWTTLFRTRSGSLLAALPLRDHQLWWTGGVDGGVWAVWAVAALALPLLAALATEAAHPLWFLAGAGISVFGLLACCLALGGIAALALARLLPLLRRHRLLLPVLLLLSSAWSVATLVRGLRTDDQARLVEDVLGRLSFASQGWLPPHWTQAAVAAASQDRWYDWLDYSALLWTSAGVLALIGEGCARWRLRADIDALAGRPANAARSGSKPWRLPPWLPAHVGLMVAKDLRLFLRDPVQLLQFGAFTGLLGFYMLMLPRLGHAFAGLPWWRPVVAVLNLVAVTMALSTFTGRFVYPLLALEGRRLWVLVLAPSPREQVVTAKLVFALALGLPVCLALVACSGLLLQLPPAEILYQTLVMGLLAVALTTGALGLGARLADPNEDNPAKLVAGYGGTINLLASLGLSMVVLGLAGWPLVAAAPTPWWLAALAGCAALCWLWSALSMSLAWRWFGELDRDGR
jgi:ABC-2 type transport system permease protein